MHLLDTNRNRVHMRLSLLQADPGLQPANPEVVIPGVRGRERNPRHPQLRDRILGRGIQVREVGGHHPNNRVAGTVELNRAAYHTLIRPEAPLPQPIA